MVTISGASFVVGCLLFGLLHDQGVQAANIGRQVVWTVIQPTTASPTPAPTAPFQAFLSHRRVPTKSLAWLVKVMLEARGVHAYLDVDDLRGGLYQPQIFAGLNQSPNFVFLLSKTTLDRTIGDTNFADMVHQEIREAVTKNKNIVLVYDEYDFPPVSQYSNIIQTMFKTPNQVTWDHAAPVDSVVRIMGKLVPAPAG